MSRLLVIDDDIDFCDLLVDYLESEGFGTTVVHDGAEGLRRAIEEEGEFDLIVLDVGLPGMNGFEVLQRIRARQETPVLMATARSEQIDRIVGLEMGADDFLAKPFSLRELVARARAILRRTKDRSGGTIAFPSLKRIVVGDIELDTGSRVVHQNGEPVELTSVEYGFLETLLKAVGRIVTRECLAKNILGRIAEANDRSVDVHLSRLRKKLGRKFGEFERIKTVRGVGYVYTYPSVSSDNESSSSLGVAVS